MIVIDGKEIHTLKEACDWLKNAWYYEPYDIYYEEYGEKDSEYYRECIEIEATRGNPGAESYTIWSLEEFGRFMGVNI